MMISRLNQTIVGAGMLLAVAVATPSAWSNLLLDPSFENNALTSDSNVLNNFAGFQGIWGQENSIITGTVGGIVPPDGVKMLQMWDDGLVATQAFQVTDVTSYASLIDSNGATATLSALFNVDQHVLAADAHVYLQFFSAANYGSQIGTGGGNNLTLNNFEPDWEPVSHTMAVPAGTRWVLSQVYYANASLMGLDGITHPGYVDAANLRIVPGPSALALLSLGVMAKRRRRNG